MSARVISRGTWLSSEYGIGDGAIPSVDADLLARAVIGAYNSVWAWYRPEGRLSLDEVADFYVPRLLAIAGLPE